MKLLFRAIFLIIVSANCQAAETIILVHGIGSSGDRRSFQCPYQPMRLWIERFAPKVRIIEFDWSKGSPEQALDASVQIGDEGDLMSGMSSKAWEGSEALVALIAEQSSSKICILAHSQGTCVALSALQRSKPVDCLILMGSPIYQGFISEAVRAASKNAKVVLNLASLADVTLTIPELGKKLILGKSVGRVGLPDLSGNDLKRIERGIRHQTYLASGDNLIENVVLTDVSHSGEKGWWSAWWLEENAPVGIWPATYRQQNLMKQIGLGDD